jgi:hypothetical protein
MTNPGEDIFWSKVDKSQDCWLWTGGKDACGYGNAWFNNTNTKAHRISYTLIVGDIPKGLVLDHLCRNPPCVNPQHLEAVTHRENCRRGIQGRKLEYCLKGLHKLTQSNTYKWTDKGGRDHRKCKSCQYTRVKLEKLRLKTIKLENL